MAAPGIVIMHKKMPITKTVAQIFLNNFYSNFTLHEA
mgnify:CR=1 FL=1